MSRHLVIIPTYEERLNIDRMIDAVLGPNPSYELLIVDDGSPDGTADAVRAKMPQYEGRLHLKERKGKMGLGTAYISGFKWGLEHDYATISEMDCDFSHDPKDLPRLIGAIENGADLAIGSRYIKGGEVKNWPRDRVLLSRYASIYVQLITWMPIKDTTAGFVSYKREVLETIDLDKIRFIGYAFQIEMKFAAWKLGFNLTEVPITFVDRIEGNSKMSKGIVSEAVVGVISMKWNSFWNSYRKS